MLKQVGDWMRLHGEAIHGTGRVRAFSISSWNPALQGAERAADATDRVAKPFL